MFAETLLLGRTRTEAERRRSLEVIDQEAKRLSHFVENMLQFAKGEAGRTKLAPEHLSFAQEIRTAVEAFTPVSQGRGVEMRMELEEGVTAPADRSALRRIMLNLMENALKYGPDEQRITVGTALFDDVVRDWVDDEGEGIPRADRERVFESFCRLNRELDRRVPGSGIGLAVVRQLALMHNGRAWAEEAPGGGARLVVEFPDAYVRTTEEGGGWAVA
jgi:signal transduction histidine kinase